MEEKKIDTNIEEGCIDCLNYFGIFSYPLTTEEVYQFNTISSTQVQVTDALKALSKRGLVHNINGFYLTENNSNWVAERQKGNERARSILKDSARYVRIIAAFPFVKGIAISGSLSKFYASENADIDYFIITSKNRLWISRTFLHLFKKLTFITGHQHYFCMNYFVDTSALKITHPNLYSAIETVTLLPVYNADLNKEFIQKNKWVTDFLPNFNSDPNYKYLLKSGNQFCKRLIEKSIDLFWPEKVNHFFMNLTDKKWRKKWKGYGYSEEDYNRAFQTEISTSKNHPDDYEKKVLGELSTTAVKQTPKK